jgi:hypothetical protein
MHRCLVLFALLPLALGQRACAPGGPLAVFVVATGRSGSTSLLRLFRNISGSDFLGENDGVVSAVHDLDARLALYRREVLSYSLVSNHAPWVFNAAAVREEYLEAYRRLVHAALNWRAGPSIRLVGFKDVHWRFHDNLTDVDFLFELFPCAKVILNYRKDAESQSRSGMWKVRDHMTSEKSLDTIRQNNQAMLRYHAKRPAQTRLVTTEELDSREALQALLDWVSPSLKCTVLVTVRTNSNGTLASLASEEVCTESTGCSPRTNLTRLLSCL